ncbi:MAG: response regulator [Candidatus Omnitrophica bacterium]|nr:response regulator [Candidatus Omnitrophota bacterium]
MSKTVLVADDERDTSDFLKRILERRGYKVSVSYDGVQAKKLLEKHSFDAVLLDCSMPGFTGLELIRFAKDKNPNTRFIIFSGYSAVDSRAASDLGADKFLQKPLTVEAIEEALK